MADIWEQMKTVDPVTHGIAEEVMKRDSQTVESIAKKMGWGRIAEEADYNQRNQGEGIAKASLFAAPFLTGGSSAWLQGGELAAQGAQAANAGMTAQEILQAEEMLRNAGAVTEAAGVSSPGLLGAGGNVMESALADTGYTPSNLIEAFKNASQTNNTPLAQNLENYGKGLLQKAQSPGAKEKLTRDLAERQGKSMLQPQQPQYQPPQQRPQQREMEPLPLPYGNNTQGYQSGLLGMSEEEKKRLRMMGIRV